MSELSDQIWAGTKIIPIKPENRVVEVEKLANGDMLCTQGSGTRFTIAADDREIQAFVVYTMLNADLHQSPRAQGAMGAEGGDQ